MEKEKKSENGKKQERQNKIEAKQASKAEINERRRKTLYNVRRIALAVVIFFVVFLVLMIMKVLHKGPIMPVPEYRQLGNDKAITEIYEYTDFACPACAMVNEKLHEILEKHGDKIKLNVKHYPLTMHIWSERAALYADCAGEQGQFFPYIDMLFKNQEDWEDKEDEPEEFMLYAEKLKIDKEKLQACLANPANLERIMLERAEGDSKGIEGTPAFIINGKYSIGPGGLFSEAERLDKIQAEKKADGQ